MISEKTGAVTDAEIAEWCSYYAQRPWIRHALRVTRIKTLSQDDSRRVYELLRAVKRKDKPAAVALSAHLLASREVNKKTITAILSGELR